ncbi:MAG: HAMP domain-containing protein [Minisyncoccia bacterium]
MNIRTKLALTFSFVTILIGSGVFLYLDSYFTTGLISKVENTLRVAAEGSEGLYFGFIESVNTRTVDWGSDGHIRNTTQKLVSQKTSAKEKSAIATELGVYFKENKMLYDPTVIIMDVLDSRGIVIASSQENRIGLNDGEEEKDLKIRFSEAIKASLGESFAIDANNEGYDGTNRTTNATTRIFSTDTGVDGVVLPLNAVLLLHFSRNNQISDILTGAFQISLGALTGNALAQTYRSEEIYLVDKEGSIITNPSNTRSDHPSLNKKVSKYLVETCFKENREIAEEYTNYDGAKVFGATMCIKRHGVMLVAEVLSSEALATLTQTRRTIILGILLTVMATIVCSILFSSIILKPLDTMVLVAKNISHGKFDMRAQVKSKDEFGYLATVFNEMLDAIEKSRQGLKEAEAQLKDTNIALEQRVKERTAELDELKSGLEEEVNKKTGQLQQKLAELEKFKQLTVGRELMMVELKKEILKLKDKS